MIFGRTKQKNRSRGLPIRQVATTGLSYGNNNNDPRGWSPTITILSNGIRLSSTPGTATPSARDYDFSNGYGAGDYMALVMYFSEVRSITFRLDIIDKISNNIIYSSPTYRGGESSVRPVTVEIHFQCPQHGQITIKVIPIASIGTGWGITVTSDLFTPVVSRKVDLPTAPNRLLTLDGVDDYGSIIGSEVPGNPFDFERDQPFSLAGVFYRGQRENIRFFEKRLANSGYMFGTATNGLLIFWFNTSSGNQGIGAGSGYNTSVDERSFCIATYDGSGSSNGMKMLLYSKDGAYSATLSLANATAGATGPTTFSSSIKNATPILIGKNYPGGLALNTKAGLAHLSAWNKELSRSECDELVNKMINDKVKDHSSYAANCVGYWREFIGNRAINQLNRNYDGILNN